MEKLIPQGVIPSSTVPSQDPTVLLASGLDAGIGTIFALILTGQNQQSCFLRCAPEPHCCDGDKPFLSLSPVFMADLYPFNMYLHPGCQIAVSPETRSFAVDWLGVEVTGATLGIIGMGSIGYKVAQRARAFNMRILYHNRNRR